MLFRSYGEGAPLEQTQLRLRTYWEETEELLGSLKCFLENPLSMQVCLGNLNMKEAIVFEGFEEGLQR